MHDAKLIPRVSVIIPAYNAALTLPKALASVLEQTETNLEVFIVNDGSSDDTLRIAESFAERDKRVHVLHLPENRGKPHALNLANAQARGVWVAVLDADDWYDPHRLKCLIDAAEASHVPMAADNLWYFDSKANAITGTVIPADSNFSLLDLDVFLRASDPMANFDYGMLKPIFHASFIRDHNIMDYEPARVGEDFYLLLHFFAVGGKAYLHHRPLYYYTQPYGSISRQWSHAGRRRYDYKLIKQVHNHFVDMLHSSLTSQQLDMFARRGQRLQAMEHFHQIRECILRSDIMGAAHFAFSAPNCLWRHIGKRIITRFRQLLFRPLPMQEVVYHPYVDRE